jgi:hypothetical protein
LLAFALPCTNNRSADQPTNQPPFKITISTGTGKESVWGGGRFDGESDEVDGDGDDFGRLGIEGQHKGNSGRSRGSGSKIQLATGGGAFR